MAVLAVVRKHADADGRSHGVLHAVQHVGASNHGPHLPGHLGCGLLAVDVVQDHGELVPADARGRVRLAGAAQDALPDRLQDLIPHLVPESVVDALEVVEVDEQQAHLASVALGVGQGLGHAVQEQMPVGQSGEGVPGGPVLEVEHALALVGDVLEHAEQQHLAAVAVQVAGHGEPRPDDLPADLAHAHFAAQLAALGQDLVHQQPPVLGVLVEHPQVGAGPGHELVNVLAAEHVHECRVGLDEFAAGPGKKDALPRGLENGLVLAGLVPGLPPGLGQAGAAG